jgi:peptidoglycan/LPS O-acetylase OafA/YrhL
MSSLETKQDVVMQSDSRPASPRHAGRLESVDMLRGIAILMVMIFHGRPVLWVGGSEYFGGTFSWFNPNTWLAVFLLPSRMGYAGVQLFFVLSGYCIHRAAASRGYLDNPSGFKLDWCGFAGRRFFRLYPAYIGALIFTIWSNHIITGQVPWKEVWGNLFMLQNTFVAPIPFNDPFWSIAVEVQLYTLYPLVLLLHRSWGGKRTLSLIALVSIGANIAWVLERPIFLGILWSAWLPWTIGFWIAEEEARGSEFKWARGTIAKLSTIVCVFVVLLMNLYFPGQPGQDPFLGVVFGMVLIWTLGRTGIVETKYSAITVRSLAWIGMISYSLYLFHRPLQFLVKELYLQSIGSIPEHFGLFLAGMALCFLIGWWGYLILERPFMNKGRGFHFIRSADNIAPSPMKPALNIHRTSREWERPPKG